MNGLFFCSGKWIVSALLLCLFFSANAQNELPEFTVNDKGGGRVVISWINKYPNMAQVAVQRSYDSLKRFSTIFSPESPTLPQNGFTDNVYGGIKVYYRIYYSLEGGAYFFTKSKRPVFDPTAGIEIDLKRDKVTEAIKNALEQPERRFIVKMGDSVLTTLMDGAYLHFKDSVIGRTKDTLNLLTNDTILLKRYIPPFVYRTSVYVYPDKDGYIVMNLPEALTKKYDLIITEEDDMPVLDIKHIKATYLTLDKADFYHGGWYKFELWEDGQIKERNKFFLAKDF